MEPAATTPEALRYWAFVSYSHRDKAAGDWLHRALETQPVPKPLVGRPTRLGVITPRLTPVFRDREELAASPDLGVRIEEALRQSRYLIVICSPHAAASPWVNKEIAFFKSLGREDRVFSLIVAGEPGLSPPPRRKATPPSLHWTALTSSPPVSKARSSNGTGATTSPSARTAPCS